jgi:amidase
MAANAASFPIEETFIAALHEAYLSGRATALSVCQAHVDRIAAYDRRGPLHGIPVLVKDNYDVAGLQTTGGSTALLGWVAEVDATVISRIMAAGGITLVKTTMSEWARGTFRPECRTIYWRLHVCPFAHRIKCATRSRRPV